jgi:hypothetical protein
MGATRVSWLAFGLSIVSILISGGVAFISQRDKARYEAKLTYELEARKRLLAAIGPLRFQLLLACRDAAARVHQLSFGNWNMRLSEYYASDTLFRILRPFAIAELIERQINYVDFSVDSSMHNLLRFHAAALECLTGGTSVRDGTGQNDLQGVDWSTQKEHPFKGTLRAAANELIIVDDDIQRCARSNEFRQVLKEALKAGSAVSVIASYIDEFRPDQSPIFWLRLVCFGYICRTFLATDGGLAGFTPPAYPWPEMLKATARPDILALRPVLETRLTGLYSQALSI